MLSDGFTHGSRSSYCTSVLLRITQLQLPMVKKCKAEICKANTEDSAFLLGTSEKCFSAAVIFVHHSFLSWKPCQSYVFETVSSSDIFLSTSSLNVLHRTKSLIYLSIV